VSVRHRGRRAHAGSAALAAVAAIALTPAAASGAPEAAGLAAIKHIVVIYEENHSFDNLYGGWEGVNGLGNAAGHDTQVDADGKPLPCLPQNDPVLATVPGPSRCGDLKFNDGKPATSPFANKPFRIDDYITPTTKSCAGGTEGGCTRDLVHRFYQEQYQINGGKQDRYTVGSDALGLTMGYYDTRDLPVYKYLHGPDAPNHAVADSFFQGAFGGSFLNHQWLIAAHTPVYDKAPANLHAVVGPDGMPTYYPLQKPVKGVAEGPLTQAANADKSCKVPDPTADVPNPPHPPAGTVCGDYAVNTIQPTSQPHGTGATLPALTDTTIGDLLSAENVDWAWYAGGWDNAAGNTKGNGWTNGPGPACDPAKSPSKAYPYCPDALFQFHHQPFNYYARYAEGGPGRGHLQDEDDFRTAARNGALKPISFVKPVGAHNEHPGYASTHRGEAHLVDLLKDIEGGKSAKDTLVVVTYDEFGGAWDHVSPPKGDKWGPGTRVPALFITPKLQHRFAIDHTQYDTTSILATIQKRWHLGPLGEHARKVNDLSAVFAAPAGPTTGGGTGGSAGGGLPITGTNVAALVTAALALMVLGAGAMILTRRRRIG
jgi:acid phosphatase